MRIHFYLSFHFQPKGTVQRAEGILYSESKDRVLSGSSPHCSIPLDAPARGTGLLVLRQCV